MQLTKVFFDAYKSLVNESLELNEKCVGLVGRNESGKSNVLYALACLSPQSPLDNSATPKMRNDLAPSLRFVFRLSKGEHKQLLENAGEQSLADTDQDILLG